MEPILVERNLFYFFFSSVGALDLFGVSKTQLCNGGFRFFQIDFFRRCRVLAGFSLFSPRRRLFFAYYPAFSFYFEPLQLFFPCQYLLLRLLLFFPRFG